MSNNWQLAVFVTQENGRLFQTLVPQNGETLLCGWCQYSAAGYIPGNADCSWGQLWNFPHGHRTPVMMQDKCHVCTFKWSLSTIVHVYFAGRLIGGLLKLTDDCVFQVNWFCWCLNWAPGSLLAMEARIVRYRQRLPVHCLLVRGLLVVADRSFSARSAARRSTTPVL